MHFSCVYILDINFDKVNGAQNGGQGHKDNYYARLHTPTYECYSEIHFSSRFAKKIDKISGV